MRNFKKILRAGCTSKGENSGSSVAIMYTMRVLYYLIHPILLILMFSAIPLIFFLTVYIERCFGRWLYLLILCLGHTDHKRLQLIIG